MDNENMLGYLASIDVIKKGTDTEVKDILKNSLSISSFEESSAESWTNALKKASIYISYPVAYDSKTFSAIMDCTVAKRC